MPPMIKCHYCIISARFLLPNCRNLLLDFPDDLVSLKSASKIEFKSLAEEKRAIEIGFNKMIQELNASENDVQYLKFSARH
ncbi:hypothetical protein ZOSMA_91G00010 [Zostera marina]|uniref:Uncharacterized protein n=1 Tax=Zostera marina TaxID=29655 RepID=A0A0K9NL98_ZOSMR|nr:hypothetical protein ZOSMA_91G00010 [Zostera marina]